MPKTLVESWPGGISTCCGGTRTAIKLDRPWQMRMTPHPESCPFELEAMIRDKRKFLYSIGQWRVIKNDFTLFDWHVMMVPTGCWEETMLRRLGGCNEIKTVLALTMEMVRDSKKPYLWFCVNIGAAAGQNYAHQHYHLYTPATRGRKLVDLCGLRRPDLLLAEICDFKIYLGGHKAGQCFILPNGKMSDPDFVYGLGATLDWIINLYAERFRSKQGLPPDFSFGMVFHRGQMRYGAFVPILNLWGAFDYLAFMREGPVILPWPHKVTLNYLLGR